MNRLLNSAVSVIFRHVSSSNVKKRIDSYSMFLFNKTSTSDQEKRYHRNFSTERMQQVRPKIRFTARSEIVSLYVVP